MKMLTSSRRMSASIKEALDNLPSGICFFTGEGTLILCNRTMHRLVFALTGRALQIISDLKDALHSLPESSTATRDGDVFCLPDGTAWGFSENPIADKEGRHYIQFTASDVTDLYRGTKDLQEKNARQQEIAKHLRAINRNVVAIMREEEILSMKIQVHSNMGNSVLHLRRFYQLGCPEEDRAELVQHLRNTVALLKNEIGNDDETDLYAELQDVAKSIGAEIVLTGTMPSSPAASFYIVTAMRECLTNAIRHAQGDTLYVTVTETVETATAIITNNGKVPTAKIKEGGGLSSLRRRIEQAGGSMSVQSSPAFSMQQYNNYDFWCVVSNAGGEATSNKAHLTVSEKSGTSFTDVPSGAYYEQAVGWAVAQGITLGTTDTTFSPSNTCTRGQIITFLWRASGSPEPAKTTAYFTDVSSDRYYFKACQWAYEQNMASGSTFAPNSPCTRAMAVEFMWKQQGCPAAAMPTFTDVPATVSYAEAVGWAVAKGVTLGTTDTTFSPDNTCTRAQIVTFLYRYLGV